MDPCSTRLQARGNEEICDQRKSDGVKTGGLFSIFQAVEILRSKNKRDIVTDPPIDLLVVVVSVEPIRHQKNQQYRSSFVTLDHNLVRLGIQDSSLNGASEAIITCRLHHFQPTIEIGDIVRFNRVSLMHDHSFPNIAPNIYRFQHSFHDPERLEYFRLGRVQSTGLFVPEEVHGQPRNNDLLESTCADKVCVDALVTWYRNSRFFANLKGHGLSALPYQYRSVRQVQACLGAISHVVANVVQLYQHPNLAENRSKKKRKFPASTIPLPPIFASLVDETHESITFYVDSHHPKRLHFYSILEQARLGKTSVSFSHVQSKLGEDDEVILVPTKDSTLTLTTDQNVREFRTTSQPETEWQELDPSPKPNNDSQEEDSDSFLCNIVDIILKQKSLRREMEKLTHLKCPDEWNLLFQSSKDTQAYCDDVVLILKSTKAHKSYPSVPTLERRVCADAHVLQQFCGSLELHEWQDVGGAVCSKIEQYRNLVCDLIHGIILEEVQFQLVIRKSNSKDHAVNASLVVL